MCKIEFIKMLVFDTEQEIAYMQTYDETFEELRANKDWDTLRKLRSPSKQRIKDNLKMVRRLSKELENELPT